MSDRETKARADIRLMQGDCLQQMRSLPDNSVDSIVTDPPYGISFMAKKWDYDVPSVEVWQEALRVLKPGGHALIACGTRTQHRMVVNIEDAGFEIRDVVSYIYGSGFPKSHNYPKKLHESACTQHGRMVECDHENITTTEEVGRTEVREHGMRFVRAAYLSSPVYACAECGQVLQPFMQKQEAQELWTAWAKSETVWPEQPSLEGRGDVEASEGKLQRCEVCTLSHGVLADGAEGWLRHGTSSGDGPIPWQVANADGGRPSYRPHTGEQLHREPSAFCIERGAQKSRGFGSALKPSCEFFTLCRKPLSEKTIAANVLKWGTGGINVDGCRVGFEKGDTTDSAARAGRGKGYGSANGSGRPMTDGNIGGKISQPHAQGRFPANLLHDGSEEVVSGFPVTGKSSGGRNSKGLTGKVYGGHSGSNGHQNQGGLGDSGTAARYFYCAKASKRDRNEGCDDLKEKVVNMSGGRKKNTSKGDGDDDREVMPRKNTHPTVKPTALMQYLCRLITPTGGTVFDPYMGSGSTGKAAIYEGFGFVGMEKEEEFFDIATARIDAARERIDIETRQGQFDL